MINFIKTRYKNIQFYLRIILISFLPILTIMGVQPEAFTTWSSVGQAILDFISDPYLLALYVFTLVQSFTDSKNEIEDVKMEDE